MLPRRLSLRFKFTAALVSVVVATALATGGGIIRYGYEALRSQKQQDELSLARSISAQAEEALMRVDYTLDYLSRNPAILSMDKRRQQDAISLVTNTEELIDAVVMSDLNGRLTVLAEDPATPRVLPKSAAEQFVAPMKRERKTTFSEIYQSRTGDLAVAVLAPVLRGGRLIGVLAGGILLKKHGLGGVDGIRIGSTGYAYIVDARGNVIIRPPQSGLNENFSAGFPGPKSRFERKLGVAELVDQKGVHMLAAYAPIERTGWGVVVLQPTSESYAFANRMIFVMTLALLLGLAGAVAVGVLLAKRIAHPAASLAEGVRQVSEGRLAFQIPIESRDEIGELAGAFNEMTLKLRRHMTEIADAHRQVLLAQKNLAQSEKMAAIGQLAAGLAHEIYNPLNVISGFGEFLLGKTAADDPRRAHLEDILREAARCQKLVAHLLDFAKPKEVERAPTDLNRLVQETLGLISSQAKAQGIEIVPRLAPDLPPAELDRDQIKQVLLNLFLNACQAMPDGGALTVVTRRAGGRVEAVVADDGAGVPEGDLQNIFNPFFTTKENGTGLGLALSYAMIERHGGDIQAENGPTRGAVFTVSLPVRAAGGVHEAAR